MIERAGSPTSLAWAILSLVLIMTWIGRAAGQDYVPRTYVARQASTPIQIDGRLDEAAWQGADTVSDFYIYLSGGARAPQATTTRFLWDQSYIYVGFELLDTHIRSIGGGHDGNLWDGDNAELFLQPTPGRLPYYEWEFSPNGDVFDALYPTRFATDPDPRLYESGVLTGITIHGTDGNDTDVDQGWSLELAIPRSSLPAFSSGDRWSFLSSRYDYPPTGDPLLMLSSPGDTPWGFHSYEVYDTLAFRSAAMVPEPASLLLITIGALFAFLITQRFRLPGSESGHRPVWPGPHRPDGGAHQLSLARGLTQPFNRPGRTRGRPETGESVGCGA
jgi:hypothetical protein